MLTLNSKWKSLSKELDTSDTSVDLKFIKINTQELPNLDSTNISHPESLESTEQCTEVTKDSSNLESPETLQEVQISSDEKNTS